MKTDIKSLTSAVRYFCTLRFHTDINQSNTDDSRRKPVFTVMDDLFQISFKSLQVHFHNVQNELKLIAAERWKHIQKSLERHSDCQLARTGTNASVVLSTSFPN